MSAKTTPANATILGQVITPEKVRQIIQEALSIEWGSHLLRWRYFDVRHEGVTYHHNALIPADLWHLLKRVYVDLDWPVGTNLSSLAEDARATVRHPNTEIYVYGYYRTDPPRLQWGFLNHETGIAVIYDVVAGLIATVFKPVEGGSFFERQIDAVNEGSGTYESTEFEPFGSEVLRLCCGLGGFWSGDCRSSLRA